MNAHRLGFPAALGLVALLSGAQTAPALAAGAAPPLGTASGYAVLATNSTPTVGEVTCTNDGSGSTINGRVGTSFTSITNTGCSISGPIDAPVGGAVVLDFGTAKSALNSLNAACDGVIPTTSTILPPGVYCSTAGTTIGTGVTFNLNGSASDIWVFRVGTSGTGALTGTGFSVVMGGSALACNVYWGTAGSATMTDSNFLGTVLSGAAITMTRGSWAGRALATTDVTVTDAATLDFAGCSPPSQITVHKTFSDSNSESVPVDLICTSGLATNTPQNASQAAPAVFTVGGASPGATCLATETVPVGYTADQTDCLLVPLGGNCTIINTLIPNTITVHKSFSDSNLASVSVSLSCNSGSAAASPLPASNLIPAVFTVNGASPGAMCTATENPVPAGYTPNQLNCVNVLLGGSCTITNTLNPNTITVHKTFSDSNLASVSVSLASCTSGTVAASPLPASHLVPAVFTVNGSTAGAMCTATEVVPPGYAADQSNCVNVLVGGSCTIVNTLNPNTITVHKTFIPSNTASVSVSLGSCTSGTVAASPLPASHLVPAVFTVNGSTTGAMCTATEVVPAGYTAIQTDCANVLVGGSCTIINTLNLNTITVNKVFNPHDTATVPVALSCTSGTVTLTPLNAAEGAPAVFAVTGASSGATCTATETIPAGYLANQTGCVNVALDGSCTITNTLASVASIPTLSGRAMIGLAVLLALAGFVAIRRLVP